MGEILIGGMASLLICIFLGPKFIDWLREKEFGQHIREDGPAGHHQKAGTPTVGGIVIFLGVCVPFLILSDYRAISLVVLAVALAAAALGFVDASIDLGYLYPLLILLVLMGTTNAVNLTDGLDGLAAGCCAIVLLSFTAMTFITHGPGQEDLALLSACLVGACVGLLWFHSFPDAVF